MRANPDSQARHAVGPRTCGLLLLKEERGEEADDDRFGSRSLCPWGLSPLAALVYHSCSIGDDLQSQLHASHSLKPGTDTWSSTDCYFDWI